MWLKELEIKSLISLNKNFFSGFDEEQDKERQSLLLAGHLNLAMSFLKIEEHIEAQEQCNKALALQPSNEKGLFRRGQVMHHHRLKVLTISTRELKYVVCLVLPWNGRTRTSKNRL